MRIFNFALTLALAVTCATAFAATSDKLASSERDLIQTIQSTTATRKEKADACRELALKGGKAAVEPLARLLVDPEMSHMARYALETIPGTAVDKALAEALGKTDGDLLAGIIGSIGVRKNVKAVSTLSSFLRYRNPTVVKASARALGTIGGNAAVKALQAALPGAAPEDKLAIAEGLLRAAEGLIEAQKIEAAMKVYDTLRTNDVPHQVRTAALRGAAMTRGVNARGMLLEALRGDDYTQAAAAARIAQFLTPPEVTLTLAAELPRLSPDKQILVMHTLAKRGDKAGLAALTSLTSTSTEKRLRIEAIRAMAQIGDPSIHPLLIDLLGTPEADVARAAQDALASLPGPAVDKAVMGLVNGTASQRRVTGFDLAARRRMTSAVPFLMKAASDTDAQVRTAAVRRLGELASPQDVPAILDMLSAAKAPEDVEAVEQALASVAVRSVNRDEVAARLISAMEKSQPAQKSALVRTITAVGGKQALQPVTAALRDPNPQVRATALRALGSWNSPAAAPQLFEIAKASSNPSERLLALRGFLGLAKLGDVPEQKRLEMCREVSSMVDKPEEKRLLLAALGDLNSPGALEIAVPYLDDATAKEEAATAAVGIAERILRRDDAASSAPKIVEGMSKVVAVTSNQDLAKRAAKLAEQAKSKTDAK